MSVRVPNRVLGSVRGCTNSGQPHWSLVQWRVSSALL